MLIHIIKILLSGILCSFYMFPVEFKFFPGINTKMIMAGVSLFILATQLARGRSAKIDKSFFVLSVIAVLVSLICYAAVTINGTNDYTYATYIVSMWVWLGGAYTITSLLKKGHGCLSVRLVCNYFIVVCVAQCIIALVIDYSPGLKNFVDGLIIGFDFVGMDILGNAERLYGIGAALDVAGTRFSSALIMIAVITLNLNEDRERRLLPLYLLAFVAIAVLGNMIARTTTVGMLLAIMCWFLAPQSLAPEGKRKIFMWLGILLLLLIPYMIYMYYISPDFKSQISFAFEGFFSLAENGKWDVSSNNNLLGMIVFPESLKTWLIGDGYIENPRVTDPYYVGTHYSGYYMGTDIGYLRFIFYFGILGLLVFMYLFFKTAGICANRFQRYRLMFWMILLANYIIWLKVATDLFVVFALFLCISQEDNDEYEKSYENSMSDPLDI